MTFDKDDISFLKALLKYVVGLRAFSIASAKYFHNSITLNETRNLIGKDLQGDESLKLQMAELEKQRADSFFSNAGKLSDMFAKLEFENDQLEAWMAELDKMFPDAFPPAQPASGA